MGQAKAKREAQRAELIAQAGEWVFPASKWEADLVEELRDLPMNTVRRASDEQLAWAHMVPRQCHQNCRWYADNSSGLFVQRSGWIAEPKQGLFVLHSVVQNVQDGQLGCITPGYAMPTEFPFIADDKIEWIDDEEAGVRHAIRNGRAVHPGVRERPNEVIAEAQRMISRLEAGEHPMDVARA
jgi:hypothetical protein